MMVVCRFFLMVASLSFATFSFLNHLDLHLGVGGVGPPAAPPHPALLRHGVVPGAAYTLQSSASSPPLPQLHTQHSHPWALTYQGGAASPGAGGAAAGGGGFLRRGRGAAHHHHHLPRPNHHPSAGRYHELPPLISGATSGGRTHWTSAPNVHALLATDSVHHEVRVNSRCSALATGSARITRFFLRRCLRHTEHQCLYLRPCLGNTVTGG